MINLINRIGKFAIPVSILTMMPIVASASTNLRADDFVGISFWIISIAMVAGTFFFFMEANKVDAKWTTSLTVAGLVNGPNLLNTVLIPISRLTGAACLIEG